MNSSSSSFICLSNVDQRSKLNSKSNELIQLDEQQRKFDGDIQFRNNSKWIWGLNRWLDEEFIPTMSSDLFDQNLRIFYPKTIFIDQNKEKEKETRNVDLSFIDRSLSSRLQQLICQQIHFYLREENSTKRDEDNRKSSLIEVDSILPSTTTTTRRINEDNRSFSSEMKEKKMKKKKCSIRHPLRSIPSEYSPSTSTSTSMDWNPLNLNESFLLSDPFHSLFRQTRRSSKIYFPNDFKENSSSNPDESKLIVQRYEKLHQLFDHRPSSSRSTRISSKHFYRNSSLRSSINDSILFSLPNTSRNIRSFDEDFPLIRDKTFVGCQSQSNCPSRTFDETSSNSSFYRGKSSWKKSSILQKKSSIHRDKYSLNQSFPVIIAGKRLQITFK